MNAVTYRVLALLIISLISMTIGQLLKILIEFIKNKKRLWSLFFTTGGMPSSHSATLISLVTALGIFQLYFDNELGYEFAVAVAFTVVVIYDAMGVRYEAGKHARILNEIMEHDSHDIFVEDKSLKELIGHRPQEVMWGVVLGLAVGIVGSLIYIFAVGK